MLRVVTALTAAPDLRAVAEALDAETSKAFGTISTGIALLENDGATLSFPFLTGLPHTTIDRWTRFAADVDSPPAEVVRTGEPVLLGSAMEIVGRWPEVGDDVHAIGLQAWAALPLRADDRVVGVLVMHWDVPQTFLDGDREVLETLAGACSLTVQRARLVEAERTACLELADERRFLRTILETMAESVVACDADGRVVVMNSAAKVLHGAHLEQMALEDWSAGLALYAPDGTSLLDPGDVPLCRALRGETVQAAEVVVGAPDTEQRILLCNGGPLRHADGSSFGAVVAQGDVTARRYAERRLRRLALHDPLTSLPNRALLLDRLHQALARSRRQGTKVAGLFVDLDRFKDVNDSLGHDRGDETLVAVAGRLKAIVRPSDTVARFGGDEFVVVCDPIVDVSDALTVADRIRDALSEPILIGGDGGGFVTVGASIGISIAGPDDEPRDLLRRSDAAMYRAKDRGRDRHVVFDDDSDAHLHR